MSGSREKKRCVTQSPKSWPQFPDSADAFGKGGQLTIPQCRKAWQRYLKRVNELTQHPTVRG